MNLSCFYLYNYLNTLIERLDRLFLNSKNSQLDHKVEKILIEYNFIIKKQRLINAHCERTFYCYFTYSTFTVLYPIVILFETQNFLIITNSMNYLMIIFAILLPPIYFNSNYFVNAVS